MEKIPTFIWILVGICMLYPISLLLRMGPTEEQKDWHTYTAEEIDVLVATALKLDNPSQYSGSEHPFAKVGTVKRLKKVVEHLERYGFPNDEAIEEAMARVEVDESLEPNPPIPFSM